MVVFIAAFDVFVLVDHNYTISEVLRDWGWKSGFAPFAIGVLGGHWFFNWNNPIRRSWTPLINIPIAVALVFFQVPPMIIFPIGVISGALFWTLEPR